MSENRRNVPREVVANGEPSAAPTSLSSRLAEYGTVHVKVVTLPNGSGKIGVPVPVTPQFTGEHARALNWAYVTKAAANAASVIDKDKSDEENFAALSAHMNGGYKFGDMGGEWDYTLLQDAADRVLFARGLAQKVYSGDYSDNENSGSVARKARLETVTKILTDASLADRYEQPVREMVATILSERHEVQKRTGKKDSVAKTIEL